LRRVLVKVRLLPTPIADGKCARLNDGAESREINRSFEQAVLPLGSWQEENFETAKVIRTMYVCTHVCSCEAVSNLYSIAPASKILVGLAKLYVRDS
jgi:hypothetical protein